MGRSGLIDGMDELAGAGGGESYCCLASDRPLPSSKTISSCLGDALRFFGLGMGVMKSARRRVSMVFWVG